MGEARPNLLKFAELLHIRKQMDYDNFICITGIKGSGKSTFAYWLGREYMKGLNRTFDIEKHVVYSDSFQEIFEKIKNAEDGDYIWFDEAGRIILAEDWNSAKSKKLKKMFAEIRTRHLAVVFVVPFSFLRIDKKYREALFNFWVWIPKRSVSVIFEPLIHPTIQGFEEEKITKILSPLKWSRTLQEDTENIIKEALKKCPSFLDVVKFPDMPQDVKQRYLYLRDKEVYTEEEEMPKRLRQIDIGFVKLMLKVSELTGKSISTISKEIGEEMGWHPKNLESYFSSIQRRLQIES